MATEAQIKSRERKLARLKEKYAAAGGSPRQLRRKAEVVAKRTAKKQDVKIQAAPSDLLEAVHSIQDQQAATE